MMSVITQNKYGFLLHPLPPTPHVHLQLIDKPYGKHSSIPEDHFDKKKKKRKRHRTTPLNAGEASLMAYHQKVRERLLNSWKTIVELGKDVGYIPVSTTLQDGEMPKKHAVPSLTDGDISTAVRNSITIQALDEDKEHILKLCLSCTYNCIDLVDLCNNNLPLSNPTDTRTPVEINDDLRCGMYNVERLCGRVVTNSTKNWAIIKHLGAHFVIPQNCTFLLSDITEFQTLVDYVQGSSHRKYDCVVLDPPWENRSAIRSHKYQWLSERDLLQLSLPLLCNNGCLVVVWVTNKVRFADFVRDELFPSWGVEFISEWHWMKVTKSGELVFDLESLHKKPYELLLLGKYQGIQQILLKSCCSSDCDEVSTAKRLKLSSALGDISDNIKVIPPEQVIVSIPSQYHSQKPYLGNLLSTYLPHGANCLELFARNLQPGWTSWGNEVLKFQTVCIQCFK